MLLYKNNNVYNVQKLKIYIKIFSKLYLNDFEIKVIKQIIIIILEMIIMRFFERKWYIKIYNILKQIYIFIECLKFLLLCI